MKNLVVAGKAGSGKDTVGDFLVERYSYSRVSLAGPMKEVARTLWPDLDWTQKQRRLLQQFGSACRDVDPETWIKLAWREIVKVNQMGGLAVVTDCRFPNELDYFLSRSCAVVRVEASYVNRVARLMARDGYVDELALQHLSETALDSAKLPVLSNDGPREDLYEQIADFLGLEAH